jgi:hypothetical protein
MLDEGGDPQGEIDITHPLRIQRDIHQSQLFDVSSYRIEKPLVWLGVSLPIHWVTLDCFLLVSRHLTAIEEVIPMYLSLYPERLNPLVVVDQTIFFYIYLVKEVFHYWLCRHGHCRLLIEVGN